MTDKERIDLYLSGTAGNETEFKTENDMMKDDRLLKQFIKASEQLQYTAPPGFAESVMRRIIPPNRESGKVPALSGKMRAAVCFCSAAAIIFFTVSGFDRSILEFLTGNFDKFNELLNTINIL